MVLIAAIAVAVLAVIVGIQAMWTVHRAESTPGAAHRSDPLVYAGMVNITVGVVFVATVGPVALIQIAVGLALMAIGAIRARRATPA